MPRRRPSGFTLVELMVVVTIVGVVGALAARLYSKGVRGDKAPAFARNLMSTMMEARHTALTLGRPVRITMAPSTSTATPAMTVTTTLYDTSSTWVDQSRLSLPTSMSFCTPKSGMSTTTPSCPLTAAKVLCFYANGRVDLPASGSCLTTSPSSGSGATVYVENTAGDKKYKLWIWGLTGMTKMMDQW